MICRADVSPFVVRPDAKEAIVKQSHRRKDRKITFANPIHVRVYGEESILPEEAFSFFDSFSIRRLLCD